MKQLSENIKNPNSNKELEDKQKQKQEFINKLSELLNEQEKVMEETFNRAAEKVNLNKVQKVVEEKALKKSRKN